MLEKLSEKDVKTLKMGGIGVVAILIITVGLSGLEYWTKARESYKALNQQLKDLDTDKRKQSGLLSIVPVLEMPVDKETQKVLLREEMVQQFDDARITGQPWLEVSGKTSPLPQYKLLGLKSSGSCRLSQMFTLLANLKENPYLVAIEELRIKCDAQNPQQIDFDITVSTFFKSERGKL